MCTTCRQGWERPRGGTAESLPAVAFPPERCHRSPVFVHIGSATEDPGMLQLFAFSPASTASIDTAMDLI